MLKTNTDMWTVTLNFKFSLRRIQQQAPTFALVWQSLASFLIHKLDSISLRGM